MISSPHGDGYCPECCFIVGLEEDGLLEVHYRGASLRGYIEAEPCPGSDRRPGRYRTAESRKAAFSVTRRKGECPECFRTVTVMPASAYKTSYFAQHTVAVYSSDVCPGSFSELPSR